ncbi:hypothetical protein O6H91_Y277300 [Diphasiastrum complanatum]|nr:hypothetical protein O6H91_Y277300 [Diphasiastrum complanatum]
MGQDHHHHHHHNLYRLTSLQIGDIQSYLSRLFLFVLASTPSKLVFLVDNGPWSVSESRSKPAELWQLMVTKSRVSPFTNRRLKHSKRKKSSTYQEGMGSDTTMESNAGGWSQVELERFKFNTANYYRWKSLFNDMQHKCNSLSLFEKLAAELDGCVAFEVDWADVRGMNYINELQVDTCVALEVKFMTKREFDTLEHALAFYGSNCACIGHERLMVPELKCSNVVTLFEDCICEGHSCQRWYSKRGSFKQGRCASSDIQESAKQISNFSCIPPSTPSQGVGPPFVAQQPKEKVQSKEDIDACYQELIGSSGCCSSFSLVPQSQRVSDNCCLNRFCKHGVIKDLQIPDGPFSEAKEDVDCNLMETQVKGAKMMEQFSADSVRNASPGSNYCNLVVLKQSGDYSDGKSQGEQSSPFLENALNQTRSTDEVARVHCNSVDDVYRDAFVLFRFSDPFLPYKLQEIITADQRLLKMLESGLPPWVIFLQSYPIFCNLYRPWMRPLALTIYIVVSVVTVLVGFYDLYKNVPILKTTVAHMFGPLFEWVESWEMVSRLKYLGTMLVLQNYEKALRWVLLTLRGLRRLILLLMQPVMEPLLMLAEFCLPAWTSSVEWMEVLLSIVSTFLQSLWIGAGSLLNFLIWPICVCLSTIWNLVMSLLYPVFSAIWAILAIPFRITFRVIELAIFLFLSLFDMLYQACKGAYQTTQLLIATESPIASTLHSANLTSQTTSIWRATWDDLFSKVFRALRYIVNGVVAFFAALNRHRLSIYNNLRAFLIHTSRLVQSGQLMAKKLSERILMQPVSSQENRQNQFDKKVR